MTGASNGDGTVAGRAGMGLGGDRTILVADGDLACMRLVQQALGGWRGLTLLEARTAEAALELSLKLRFDLVIFGWFLHGIEGRLLHSMIRRVYEQTLPRGVRCPPLLLLVEPELAGAADESVGAPGVIGCLIKPFTLERLTATVRECLRGVPGSRPGEPRVSLGVIGSRKQTARPVGV